MNNFDGWTTPVTVHRGGGRDARGNPKPETLIPVPFLLIGWRSTSDPIDRGEVTSDFAIAYDEADQLDWNGADRIEIQADYAGPVGMWQVDGQPKRWPLGWEIPLRKAA